MDQINVGEMRIATKYSDLCGGLHVVYRRILFRIGLLFVEFMRRVYDGGYMPSRGLRMVRIPFTRSRQVSTFVGSAFGVVLGWLDDPCDSHLRIDEDSGHLPEQPQHHRVLLVRNVVRELCDILFLYIIKLSHDEFNNVSIQQCRAELWLVCVARGGTCPVHVSNDGRNDARVV